MTRREAPSFRDRSGAAAPRKTALRTFGRVARAGLVGSAMLLTLGSIGAGCLDRPTAPAEPRTSNTFSERVSLTQIDKIDLLFMIDNSASMADKQAILAKAVPDLVGRLVSPDCVQVDADGKVTSRAKSAGGCAAGFSLEFNAIKDIHIGVVTSSLGGHGSDQCNPAVRGEDDDDHARLVTRGAAGTAIPTWAGNAGFFQWDPNGAKEPAGDSDANKLVANFSDVVRGAGQTGCGFESSLEGWYRFLVDPNPPAKVSILDPQSTNLGPASVEGIDEALLQQRAEFLRPDSLVAVIALSDENDCSVADGVLPPDVKRFDGSATTTADGWNLADNGGFILNYAATTGSAGNKEFRMKSGTTACASDPSSPDCNECFVKGGAGCRDLTREEDNLSLRCWDQKRRFGVDMLYPVQRYVDGLREAEVFDLRTPDGTTGAALVANPLFQDLPFDLYQSLKAQLADGSISQEDFDRRTARLGNDISSRGRFASRSTDSVFFAGIIGVPWQDIAVNPNDLSEGYVTADKVDYTNLIATNGAPPKDPLMIEAVKPRSGTHPVTGEKISATDGNKVNGHEWNSGEQDLMYACFLPLPEPQDCGTATGNCDCTYLSPTSPAAEIQAAADAAGNPLCQKATGQPFGQTQYHAKAYPGSRFVQVMERFKSGSILASICTPNVTDDKKQDFGYRPAVNAIIDRLKSQLTGKCTPRRLAQVDLIDSAGNPVQKADGSGIVQTTPCLIVDAQKVPDDQLSACKACDGVGRLPLETSPNVEALLRRNPDVDDFNCLCQVRQFTNTPEANRLDQCQAGSDEVGQGKERGGSAEADPQGWCYIDNSANASNDSNPLTKNCPSHSTIRLATDTNKSTFFITCLGAGLSSGPATDAAAGTQLVFPGSERNGAPLSSGAPFSFCLDPLAACRHRGSSTDQLTMSAKKTILMIEDEPHIVLGVRDALEFEGFRFLHADRGKDGVNLARQEAPDAVLLDLMLPDMNGYQVCQELRRWDAFVPILMLTARSQEADKIRGLDAGADDYVTKPFGVGELIARIRALFRRANRVAEPSRETFSVGAAAIDLAAHTLTRGDEKHQLSFYEVELLRLLFERAGQPVSRDEILSKVWGLEATPSNRTVDNFIVKLRKKVESSAEKPEHILTVYGYGYKLVL